MEMARKKRGTKGSAPEDTLSPVSATDTSPDDLADELFAALDTPGSDDEPAPSLPLPADGGLGPAVDAPGKMSRQKARLARRDEHASQLRAQAEAELEANGGMTDEAAAENKAIRAQCETMRMSMVEMTPDGHCLFSALADQLNTRYPVSEKYSYQTLRGAAAHHMREHSDVFMPFISDYDESMAGVEDDGAAPDQRSQFLRFCDKIEQTSAWGGQPEILALSRVFHTPIHVVQGDYPILKIGADENSDKEPLTISYHRKMYGLGEHYNSLRPLSASA
ncbi:ubiquitinyl hydrolase 1 [Malassezia sp. CBS 17886]|nr:ubiquitinyl hydrolase 1 [Malassezia sp. CBS 17886]